MKPRPRVPLRLLAAALPLLAGGAAGAADPATATVDDVVACMEENQPRVSSVQTISMNSKDRIGAVTTMHADLYWQKSEEGLSQIHIRFDDPPDLRDSALLMLEKRGHNDVFMYLPELGRTRRVTTDMMNGSMFGTDFTYEDFQVLQGIAETASRERGEDAELEGRKAYVVVQTPRPEDQSVYERIHSYVDQETCLIRRIEFFGRGGQLRKVLDSDWSTASEVGGVWIAKRIVLKDQVEETSTELEIEKVEMDVDIPRRMFSQASLEKRR